MTQTEALRLALEALKSKDGWGSSVRDAKEKAIAACEAALEAKDEPDKYAMDIECTKCGAKQSGVLTVHATPPQRKPLTDEDIALIDWESLVTRKDCVRAIEAKLKEKNT